MMTLGELQREYARLLEERKPFESRTDKIEECQAVNAKLRATRREMKEHWSYLSHQEIVALATLDALDEYYDSYDPNTNNYTVDRREAIVRNFRVSGRKPIDAWVMYLASEFTNDLEWVFNLILSGKGFTYEQLTGKDAMVSKAGSDSNHGA